MFNWIEVREGIADLVRDNYTPRNGRHVLVMGCLWKKSDSTGNNLMKKICTSEQFHEYFNERSSNYTFTTHALPDWADELQDVTVVISYISTTANEFDAQPIYLKPFAYLSNDAEKKNIWESLNDEEKSSIEVSAFLYGGYCK